jgi:hypothetical protein
MACGASLAALAAAGTSPAFTPLNACRLVTRAEASRIIRHPVILHEGESIQGCTLRWKRDQGLTTIDVYNDAQATRPSQSFSAYQKRLHGTAVGGLGNPAFYYNHSQSNAPSPGLYISRGIWVHHHGWVLQVVDGGSQQTVLSRNQLLALTKIALRRF